MATTKDTPAAREQGDKSAVKASDLAAATAKDGVLFDVRDLDASTDKIDSDVDVLMVVHPKDLTAQTEFAIDQYVLGGGHALIFVDPNAETDASATPMMMSGATFMTAAAMIAA